MQAEGGDSNAIYLLLSTDSFFVNVHVSGRPYLVCLEILKNGKVLAVPEALIKESLFGDVYYCHVLMQTPLLKWPLMI